MTKAVLTGKALPCISVSWGELIDKVTILEIKEERFTNSTAVANVRRELAMLRKVVHSHGMDNTEALELAIRLKVVNQKLWDIEDAIRAKERDGSFDEQFIELARSVYMTNDHRAAIKRAINERFSCGLIEEKSYQDYTRPSGDRAQTDR